MLLLPLPLLLLLLVVVVTEEVDEDVVGDDGASSGESAKDMMEICDCDRGRVKVIGVVVDRKTVRQTY